MWLVLAMLGCRSPAETAKRTPATDLPAETDTDSDEPGALTAEACFGDLWDGEPPVDYDQFGPVLGSHCYGTDHQDIEGVERVVFVGDSIAVGTPPTPSRDWWRNRTADALANRFGLQPPGSNWRNVNLLDGVARQQFSGDFAVCAKWGARTDDLLLEPHEQLISCMPEEDRHLRTLVLMSIGGNDIFSLLEDINAGVDEASLRAGHERALRLLREGVEWILEPGRFDNGVYVVFTNTYDFTDPDGAEDVARCDGAQLINLDVPLRNPLLHDILSQAQEEYVRIATRTETDVVFLGEAFCGHGYNRDNRRGRCYRGAGAALYYDFTCEHPNSAGHAAISELFLSTIGE